MYGLASGVISTALLQPFENVKMALMLPPRRLERRLSKNFVRNVGRASEYILEADGVRGLYKGLTAAALKAATGCYVYFSVLRLFEDQEQSASKNFAVSCAARIASTVLTNPLSIIETRFELADFHGYSSVQGALAHLYANEGVAGFFSGTLTSCLK